MTVDAQQSLFRIVAGGWGIFYALRADGAVQWWYNTGWQTGAVTWANGGSPRTIGSGFHDFIEVLGSTDGTLWGIRGDGTVWRYRYLCSDLNTGAGSWENGGVGVQIGSGYNQFRRFCGGPDGILWAVDDAGDLWRSVYSGGALTAPVKVGGGFQDTKWIGADSGGVLYGLRMGALCWWRYAGGGWVNNGMPIQIGDGAWDDRFATFTCAAGTGLFYSVKPTSDAATNASDLIWNRLSNYQTVASDGGASWANSGNQKTIGSGFSIERDAPLQGYAAPFSASAGGSVGVCVSTTHPSLTMSVVRHDLAQGPVEVLAAQPVAGVLQTLPAGFVAGGCGWSPTVSLAVDAAWQSGVYSARLVGPYGKTRHIPFVVKPPAPKAQLAVILPTLTYESYNTWGGHSAYSNVANGRQVQISLRRPSRTTNVEPRGQLDAELYSDLLLLRWLSGQGVSYDVYTDQDLHQDLGLPGRYRAVMLGSHPEYVTGAMRQALHLYVKGGGRLIYPGGNGLYESCELSADGATGIWRTPTGARYIWRDRLLPEHQILGVGWDSRGWMTFAPYKVLRPHPILSGTGLAVGDTFGGSGFNHAASGWEFDMVGAFDGSAVQADVIAQGQNGTGYGAQMVLLDRPGGGRVFSAGSLTFAGALAADPALSLLFRNVVNQMLQGATPVPSGLIQPPYRADGYVHCWVPGRALARCGDPDSQNTCDIANDTQFVLYPREYRCPTCDAMLSAGEDGPRTWPT